MRLPRVVKDWLARKGETAYRSKPDPFIVKVIDPQLAKLEEREARMRAGARPGESFLTDHMRGDRR